MAIILSHPGAIVRSVLTEIKTERLLLRRLREGDRENIVALQADPETNRFNLEPHTVEGARELYDVWMKQWAEREIPDVPVIAGIMASNKPSIRVAERLGFEIHTEEEFAGEPALHMRR